MSADSGPVTHRRPPTAHELRTDIWLAGAIFVAATISFALGLTVGFFDDESPGLEWALVYSVAISAPLAFRRRLPSTVAVLVSVIASVAVSVQIPDVYIGTVAVFIALYTVGAWENNRQRAAVVRIAIIGIVFVWMIVSTVIDALGPAGDGPSRAGAFSPYMAFVLLNFLINIAYYAGAYYLGERAHASALERLALEARTEELERERERTAAQAVALERVRIARELHDVVAHHVSAMGVQAGAARSVLDRDPAAARGALTAIEESSRDTIEDLHQLLETLRTDPEDAADSSTVGIDAIPDLVAHARANGLPTTCETVGDPYEVPGVVAVNAYRITQEALTNARRHGDRDATATVRIRYADDMLDVEITSSGRVLTAQPPGLGTLGMRERAAASGGTIEIGPRPRGGYLVRFSIPRKVAAAA